MKEKTEVREAGNENMLRTYLSSKFQEQKINIPVMMQSFQLEWLNALFHQQIGKGIGDQAQKELIETIILKVK